MSSQLYGRGVGSDIYEGAATYGRIKTTITMIIGTIIAIVLIFVGFRMRSKPDQFSEHVTTTIVTPNCTNSIQIVNNRSSNVINCALDIKYTIAGKEYTNKLGTNGKYYSPGQTIDVRYDPSNPMMITTAPTNKTIGNIIIGVALLIILFAVVSWYIAQKSKFGASLVAGNDVVNIFRRD